MKYNAEHDLFVLNLLNTKGIGSVFFLNLLESFGGELSSLIDSFSEVKQNFPQKLAMLDTKELLENDLILAKLANLDIKYKFIWDLSYPENLRQISDPPAVIFYKGELRNEINTSISIVGTRSESVYGRSSAIKFSEELSDYGYAIISGMAIGIDKFAHLGALKANGYPVAVLASSVEKPTPEVNADLYRKILNSGGTIISEYFPDTIVRPGMFASRNRIVAGLSMGTFVVEAGKKSGSLITASLANQYNREVFALPGRINNLQSYGTNELIKKGEAKLVTSVDDIIEEFGYSQGKTVLRKDDRKSIMQNLTREEEIVYTCLLTEAKFLEQISLETQISSRRLISILPMLELKDLLSRESDGRYYLSI